VSDGWLRLPGGDARVLVDGGAAIVELTTAPNDGPPTHIHAREDEAFLVLDGDCEFYVDGAASSATRGTFVLGPRGIPHA
jgi:quercetin dioxygenase-like cupin family protein